MEARNYVLARTPQLYQDAMVAKIEADWPVPPLEDQALTESRVHDRNSYKRSADPNPNFDPKGGGQIRNLQAQADQRRRPTATRRFWAHRTRNTQTTRSANDKPERRMNDASCHNPQDGRR